MRYILSVAKNDGRMDSNVIDGFPDISVDESGFTLVQAKLAGRAALVYISPAACHYWQLIEVSDERALLVLQEQYGADARDEAKEAWGVE